MIIKKFYINKKTRLLLYFLFLPLVILGVLQISIKALDVESIYLYHPTYNTYPVNQELKNKTEVKSFYTSDKVKLAYWHLKGQKDKPAIVFCHGYEYNVSYFQEKIAFLAKKGYEVFMLDYRGFGKSKGEPDEEGLYTDLKSFIKYLDKSGVKQSRIVLWGYSLGGGVVTDIASKFNVKGVILEGAFTSVKDVQSFAVNSLKTNPKNFYGILYADFLSMIPITQKFENSKKVGKIKPPLLIIHSKHDGMIPVEMAYRLARFNPRAELYISDIGNHSSLGWQDLAILNFLSSIR